RLLRELLRRAQVSHPVKGGPAPSLCLGPQLGTLTDRSNPQAIYLRVSRGRRIDRCAAFRAERLCTLVTAFGGFDVNLGLPGLKLQRLPGRAAVRAVRGS